MSCICADNIVINCLVQSASWYYYSLRADGGSFTSYLNDYPKLGAWADGWYMSANMFQQVSPATGFGVRVWALDRAAMVAGGELTAQYFDVMCGPTSCYDSFLPAMIHGTFSVAS